MRGNECIPPDKSIWVPAATLRIVYVAEPEEMGSTSQVWFKLLLSLQALIGVSVETEQKVLSNITRVL